MAILKSVACLQEKYESKIKSCMDQYARLMSLGRCKDSAGVYGWFPFFQAFTPKFLENILKRRELTKAKTLADVFMGSGNSLVACIEFGKVGYGVDISPLFHFISHVKTSEFTIRDFRVAEKTVKRVQRQPSATGTPKLSSFKRLFGKANLQRLSAIKEAADKLDEKPRKLLLFGLASILIDVSKAKRDGKALHMAPDKRRVDVKKTLTGKLDNMAQDYARLVRNGTSFPMIGDARDLSNLRDPSTQRSAQILEESIDCVVSSPPYCNSSDYVEMYKLEHWFLGFVSNYEESRSLSHSTLRSHTNILRSRPSWTHPVVEDVCRALEDRTWEHPVPDMVRGYFDDLHTSLFEISKILRPGGHVFLIIGNSCYNKTPIPCDLLAAEAADGVGLGLREIDVARQITTSGQQMALIDSNSKRFLRESIVILAKE